METWFSAVRAGLAGGGVFVYPLLLLGLIGAACIVDRAYVHFRYARAPRGLVRLLGQSEFAWRDVATLLETAPAHGDYVDFFQVIVDQADQPIWWIEARAAERAAETEGRLDQGLWILETVTTAAPLLGLLGTISGMIGAFRLFGGGTVDPGAVTGGVAEALISTAIGIGIALLSLAAFNFFSHRNARVLDGMERLGTRLIDRIRLARDELA